MVRQGKNVGKTFADQCAAFLVHQDFECLARVLATGRAYKANVPELATCACAWRGRGGGSPRSVWRGKIFSSRHPGEPNARCCGWAKRRDT